MSVEIEGVNALRKKFDDLSELKGIKAVITINALKLVNRLATYPPPPNNNYKRTGTLGRRWTSKVESSKVQIVGIVGNNTSYAPWVQSTEKVGRVGPQAKQHKGRWQTAQGELEKLTPQIEKDIQSEVDRLLR